MNLKVTWSESNVRLREAIDSLAADMPAVKDADNAACGWVQSEHSHRQELAQQLIEIGRIFIKTGEAISKGEIMVVE